MLSRARGAVPAHHGMSGSGAEQLVRARRALRATEPRRAIGPAARFAPAACCVRGHCGTREGRPYSSDRLSEVSANSHDASAAIPRIALRRPTALPDTDGDWDAGDQLIIAREGRIDETTKAVGHRSTTSGQPGSEGPSTASSDSLFLCARCPAAGGPIAGASDRLRDRLGCRGVRSLARSARTTVLYRTWVVFGRVPDSEPTARAVGCRGRSEPTARAVGCRGRSEPTARAVGSRARRPLVLTVALDFRLRGSDKERRVTGAPDSAVATGTPRAPRRAARARRRRAPGPCWRPRPRGSASRWRRG